MYLLGKYNLVLLSQLAYEQTYVNHGVAVTSEHMQNTPEYFYTMCSYDFLNSLKSEQPQSHLYSVAALGTCILLLGFLGWGML